MRDGPVLAPVPGAHDTRSLFYWLLVVPRAYVRGWRRVRPTTEGWIFLVSAGAVLLAAVNTGNNLLYLVLATMLSMVALSGILSELAIRGTRVRRRLHEPAFAGRTTRGSWSVSRPTGWGPGLGLRLQELRGPHLELDERGVGMVLYLSKGQRQTVPACWSFSRRGRHRLRGVRVSTTWPFGIFVKSSDFALSQDVVVFPEPLEHALVRTPGDDRGSLEARSPQAGGDGDFLGLREHAPGEDPRRVHWRSSARLGRLVSIERAQSSVEGRIEVRVRQPGPGSQMERSQALEVELSRATFALCEGIQRGSEVRVQLPDGGWRTVSDRGGLFRVLEGLATLLLAEDAA
ncbi:MAG: hypothetical protein CL928_04330 [Deltaproteobacteria bacterium]|nr:hypothetical protein [Deltaproteobacteria bacterium]